MVNFFNPGGNREFTGNRAQWNPMRTNGNKFYGGPSQVQGHQYGGGMGGGFGGGMGGGAPSMTNWMPPNRNQPPMGGQPPQMANVEPPQTGGPLPPYNPGMGAERPGTYGVGPGQMPQPQRPRGFLGNPGVGGVGGNMPPTSGGQGGGFTNWMPPRR